MIEDFGIELVQMMENAGRALAHLGRVHFLGGDPRGKRVTVLAGTGGNGGALVCARRLHNWGARVGVLVTKPDEGFVPVPAHQLRILRRMGVEVGSSETAVGDPDPDLIVDGLIGYSLKGGAQGHGRRTHSLGRRPRLSRSCPGRSLRRRHHHRHCLRTRRAGRGDHDPGLARRRLAGPARRGAGRRVVPGRHRRTPVPLRRTRPGPKGGQHLLRERHRSAALARPDPPPHREGAPSPSFLPGRRPVATRSGRSRDRLGIRPARRAPGRTPLFVRRRRDWSAGRPPNRPSLEHRARRRAASKTRRGVRRERHDGRYPWGRG